MENTNCFTCYYDNPRRPGFWVVENNGRFCLPVLSEISIGREDVIITPDGVNDDGNRSWVTKTQSNLFYLQRVGFKIEKNFRYYSFSDENACFHECSVSKVVLNGNATGKVILFVSEEPLDVEDHLVAFSVKEDVTWASKKNYQWMTYVFLENNQDVRLNKEKIILV